MNLSANRMNKSHALNHVGLISLWTSQLLENNRSRKFEKKYSSFRTAGVNLIPRDFIVKYTASVSHLTRFSLLFPFEI